jgi:8-oxo-dGTP pyrophosphatase MutT (NUDIX family)
MGKIKAYGICLYIYEKKDIKVLLCKSVSSLNRWGFLKGVRHADETQQDTAKREFLEECSIDVPIKYLDNYFEQINVKKDIGIYLIDGKIIKNLSKFFNNNILLHNYLSWENSKVKFFSINFLPIIKRKQNILSQQIIDFLKNKNPHH